MERLKKCIPDSNELSFISDRHSSIWKAVRTVFPLSHHGCCSVHLWANCKTQRKCPASLKPVFNEVFYAYTKTEFDNTMKRMLSASPSLYNYLTEDSNLEYCSMCHLL